MVEEQRVADRKTIVNLRGQILAEDRHHIQDL